jgi:thymidine kinase
MFSGKSEELLRRVRRAMIARRRVQVFKSHLDGRYAGLFAISSHDGRTVDAMPVDSSLQVSQRIDPLAHVIAIDEAQFPDDGIVQVATSLAERGRRVILAGLDTDFRGEPFGPCRSSWPSLRWWTSSTRSACFAARRLPAPSG